MRQALGLPLDGQAIATGKQIAQFLNLQLDDLSLLGIEQALAIGLQRTFDRLDQTLGVDLLLAQCTGSLVVAGILEGVLQHPRDLAIGQAIGRLDLNARLDPGTQPVSYTHLDVYKRQVRAHSLIGE